MSSKRTISLISRQIRKKPRRHTKGMMKEENTKGSEGGGHTGALPTMSSPPSGLPLCHILQNPIKAALDKKEYRVIQLENGLRALLISDLCRIPVSEEEDESEEDENDDGDEEEDESTEPEDEEEEEEEEMSDGDDEGRKGKSQKDSTKYLAAASLTVGTGSFEDPEEIPGFMHFLEHMVFMGSEKYPKENAFDYFIKTHGGHDNAHTDMEHTTFIFELQEKYLREGLDRFAQFFIKPLMKKEAMTREREAVHSEFQMALPDDGDRGQQLFASLATPSHPMSKFTWGNEATLNTGIPDDILHERLHELRRKYYSAHYMTLAVQARLSLDCLQEYVCSIFDKVPNNQIPRPAYTNFGFPFKPERFHRLLKMIPVGDYHKVELIWALPSQQSNYRTNPLYYMSHLLGYEGKGSVLSYLRKRAWADELYAGNDETGFEHNATYAMFSIGVELTDEGFRHIEEVLCAIFQYILMMRTSGPQEKIFRELHLTEDIGFEYAEELSTIDNVETLSEAMQLYPPKDYLKGSSSLDDYNPHIIQECLDAILPHNCNILIKSKTFEKENICNLTEKWFGTKYSEEEIPESWKTRWVNLTPNPELHLPEPNLFIPDNFTLLPQDSDVPEYPEKIYVDVCGDLWYRQDIKFKLPRTYCYIGFITSLHTTSPRLAALQDLYLNLYRQQVIETLYPSTLCQYSYHISGTDQGIALKLNGFNQKLPEVLKLLLNHMETFKENLDEKIFLEIRQQLMKSYHNSVIKPSNVRRNMRLSLLQKIHWPDYLKLGELKDITSEHLLKEYVQNLFPSSKLRVLVQGNSSQSEAIELYKMVKATVDKQPRIVSNPPSLGNSSQSEAIELYKMVKATVNKQPRIVSNPPSLQTHELPNGSYVLRAQGLNPADSNSSIVNYYQHKPGDLHSEILLEFIQMVMDEPVFDVLRTREQLGYHVYCTNHNTYGILGLSVTVNTQANKFSASHVDERIESFLAEFLDTVRRMKDDEMTQLKETLTSMKQTIDLTLREEVNRNWNEMCYEEYVFDRLNKQIELIKDITKERVVECLQSLTENNNNPQYKKLSVQVVGSADIENQSPPSMDQVLGQTEILKLLGKCEENSRDQFIMDIPAFKSKLKLYPFTKIQ